MGHLRILLRNSIRNRQWNARRKHFQKRYYSILGTSPFFESTSIISSNCWGGMLYHDAGLKFLSPTINLTFAPNDFIYFAKHLSELKKATMAEDCSSDDPFPVGTLTYPDGRSIKIRFVHYKTYEEGMTKFWERAKRISNHIVVILMTSELTKDVYEGFLTIGYKKICVYGSADVAITPANSQFFIKFPKMLTSKRDILSFKRLFGRQIIIDDLGFDWYAFAFGPDA